MTGQFATASRGGDSAYLMHLIGRGLPLSVVTRMSGRSLYDVQAIASAMVRPKPPKPDPAPIAYTWPESKSPPEEGTMGACTWWTAKRHGLKMGDLRGVRLDKVAVIARHEAMWECAQVVRDDGRSRFSISEIGRYFGGRKHASALFAIRAHAARLKGEKLDRKRGLGRIVVAGIAAE